VGNRARAKKCRSTHFQDAYALSGSSCQVRTYQRQVTRLARQISSGRNPVRSSAVLVIERSLQNTTHSPRITPLRSGSYHDHCLAAETSIDVIRRFGSGRGNCQVNTAIMKTTALEVLSSH